jgi:hypothetical protein
MLVGIVAREDLGIAGLEVLPPRRLDVDDGFALGRVVCAIGVAHEGLVHVVLSGRVCYHTGRHGEGGPKVMAMGLLRLFLMRGQTWRVGGSGVSEGKLEVLCMKSSWSSVTASGMQTAWPETALGMAMAETQRLSTGFFGFQQPPNSN